MSKQATARPDAPFIVTLVCHAPDNVDVEPIMLTVETRRTDDGYLCSPLGWGGRGPVGRGATIASAEQDLKSKLCADGLDAHDIEMVARLAGQRLAAEIHPYMSGNERRGYVLGGEALTHLADLIGAFAVCKPPSEPITALRDLLLVVESRASEQPALSGLHEVRWQELAAAARACVDLIDRQKGGV